jgi:hypothetical protein
MRTSATEVLGGIPDAPSDLCRPPRQLQPHRVPPAYLSSLRDLGIDVLVSP